MKLGSMTLLALSLLVMMGSLPIYGRDEHVKSVTLITEVFGDGQRITAVAIEYAREIRNSTISTSTFSVDGRSIVRAYANGAAEKASRGTNGRFAILELSPSDKGAAIFVQAGPRSSRREAKVSVTQAGEIVATDGQKYAPNGAAMINDKVVNLVVDNFVQREFHDSKTGKTLKYNLFVPRKYDKTNQYPAVLFIHDAGVLSSETKTTLIQGLGAVIWATPSEQAKHESFVIAPQYASVMTNEDLDVVVNLIDSLSSEYSIDKNRLYATGQSMGCMYEIAMSIKYPDLFAGLMLVAGQWDAQAMSVLAHKNMWILVSEGDTRAFPGMNASTASMEVAGAKVSRARWNGRAEEAERAANVRKMTEEGANIKYVTFEKGTVLPEDQAQSGRNEHMQTWWVAYSIEGVRDWLFSQKK